MAYFGVVFFADMGGGGGQNYFHSGPVLCKSLRDYLSDIPLLRAMGLLVSQHGQLGAIPPRPFLSVSPMGSMRSGGAIPPPPPKRGISAILARYPMKTRRMGAIPPLRYYLAKVLRDRGGISHWAAKFEGLAADIFYLPLFLHPPALERYFQGWGGGGLVS